MIRFQQVEKSFGAQAVLRGVSFDVRGGEAVALVGANGAGKSTLLRIAAGEERADAGQVLLGPGERAAYLPQDAGVRDNRPLWDEMLLAFGDLAGVRERLRTVEARLASTGASGAALAALVEEQGLLLERYDALGGYRVEAEIHTVLAGLGFRQGELHKRTLEFSGGWQMRIALAKLLVQRPEVLLLDEPTNHLDLDASEWLEAYLLGYAGSVLVVSHDRYFLDRVAKRTVELRDGCATVYAGGYSAYAAETTRRRAAEQAAFERQER